MSVPANLPPPPRHVVRRRWGAVVVRDDTGGPEFVYHSGGRWPASYTARNEFSGKPGPRTWEEVALGIGLPIAAVVAVNTLLLPFWLIVPIVVATTLGVLGMRVLARRATTARRLDRGKAIRQLVLTGNDDLIEAAIGTVIAMDSDPRDAARLIAELDDAWQAAERSSATEKAGIIAALRQTAADFPTTDDGVAQVRKELAVLRRSLAALDRAQQALDATTSTADMVDPPQPPASLGLLRAASQGITEDAQVVLEVAEEQSALKRGEPR